MDSVQNYQDQLITRSFFIRSAQRLQNISQAHIPSLNSVIDVPLEELYMVVDIYDGKRSTPLEESLFKQTLDFLQALPAYQALAGSNSSFAKSVRDAAGTQDTASLIKKRLDAQTTALYHISKSAAFSDHLLSVMAFYAFGRAHFYSRAEPTRARTSSSGTTTGACCSATARLLPCT